MSKNKKHPKIAKLTSQIDALYVELKEQHAILKNTISIQKRRETRSEIRFIRIDLNIAKSARRATYSQLNK